MTVLARRVGRGLGRVVVGVTVVALVAACGSDDSSKPSAKSPPCTEAKKFDDADATIRDADARIATNKADSDAYFVKGVAQYQQQKFADAAASFRSATVLESECGLYYRALGQALADEGNLDEAKTSLDRAISLDDRDGAAFLARGIIFGRQNRLDDAVADFNKVIALDPRSVEGHYNLGIALLQKQNYEGAIAEFDAVIAIDPKSGGAYLNKARALRALGRTAEADAATAKAKELGVEEQQQTPPDSPPRPPPVGPTPPATAPPGPPPSAPPDLRTLLLTAEQAAAAAGDQGALVPSAPLPVPALCKGIDDQPGDAVAEEGATFSETVRSYGGDGAKRAFTAVTAEAKVGCLWQSPDGSALQLTALFTIDAPPGNAIGYSLNTLSPGGTSSAATFAVVTVGARVAIIRLGEGLDTGLPKVRALAAAAAKRLAA